MNTVGRKIADKMIAMATTGPETYSMALSVAAFGAIPSSM